MDNLNQEESISISSESTSSILNENDAKSSQNNFNYNENYLAYTNFLKNASIKDFNELCTVLVNKYHMKVVSLSYTHKNLKMFVSTSFADENDPIVQLHEYMIIDITKDVKNIVYCHDYTEKIKPSDVFNFPLNIEHFAFFTTTNMVLFIVFFYDKKWRIVADYYDSQYFIINESFYTEIFNECCVQNNFKYSKTLDKTYTYLFYLKHKSLISLHDSFRSEIYFYRMYCREKYCNISHLFYDQNVQPLTIHIFENKYQFYDIIAAKNANICRFIIDKKPAIASSNTVYAISSCTYQNLLIFARYAHIYDKFLKIKQETQTDSKEQKMYLQYFKFTKLDKIFKQMISDFYDKYFDTYVNKIDSNLMKNVFIEHKNRILYEIHFIHLQTNKPVFKADVERIFLYIIDQIVIIECLQTYHALYGSNYQ